MKRRNNPEKVCVVVVVVMGWAGGERQDSHDKNTVQTKN